MYVWRHLDDESSRVSILFIYSSKIIIIGEDLRDRAIETEQMRYGTSFLGSKYCLPTPSCQLHILKLSKTPRSYLFSFIYALPPILSTFGILFMICFAVLSADSR